MKQIRVQIHDLIEQHGATFTNCPGCSICSEIETLRNRLLQDPADRFAHILQKGEDMTKSDIKFLLDNEVTKRTIQKHLKMSNNVFVTLMTNFGMIKKKPKGESVMAKITKEEYQDLKAKGLTDKAIAEKKDMAASYLSTMKKQWNVTPDRKVTVKAGEEIRPLIDKIKDIPVYAIPEIEPVDVVKEKDDLIKSLQEQLIDKGNDLLELQAALHQSQEQIDKLTTSCTELEKQLYLEKTKVSVPITPDRTEEIGKLKTKLKDLHEEMVPLRLLALRKLQQDLDEL